MTGTNCTLDAARNGPKRPRQLLRKRKLADGKLFSHLTAHANGWTPILIAGVAVLALIVGALILFRRK
jgi:hypothetical protein